MVEIEIRKGGPFHVIGAIELRDADGTVIETDEHTFLCRCGFSKRQPFCDGEHKKSEAMTESEKHVD